MAEQFLTQTTRCDLGHRQRLFCALASKKDRYGLVDGRRHIDRALPASESAEPHER
jgi:hypothetical protein